MKEHFTINRNGTFKAKFRLDNQCKAPGHRIYVYSLRVKCGPKLDKKGFVIDHVELDKNIQNTVGGVVSSCETVCERLAKSVLAQMWDHGCKVHEVYVKVRPKVKEEIAFMEYTLTT